MSVSAFVKENIVRFKVPKSMVCEYWITKGEVVTRCQIGKNKTAVVMVVVDVPMHYSHFV